MKINETEVSVQEILTALKSEENAEEYQTLKSDEGFKTTLNSEMVEAFIGTDEGKRFMQPKLDTYHTKGLKTWQDKHLAEYVSKDDHTKLLAETDSKITEIEKANTQNNISIDYSKMLLKNGLKVDRLESALKLSDTSKLNYDNGNLIGGLDVLNELKTSIPEFFGKVTPVKGTGTTIVPPVGGQSVGNSDINSQSKFQQDFRRALGLK